MKQIQTTEEFYKCEFDGTTHSSRTALRDYLKAAIDQRFGNLAEAAINARYNTKSDLCRMFNQIKATLRSKIATMQAISAIQDELVATRSTADDQLKVTVTTTAYQCDYNKKEFGSIPEVIRYLEEIQSGITHEIARLACPHEKPVTYTDVCNALAKQPTLIGQLHRINTELAEIYQVVEVHEEYSNAESN